MHPTTTAAPQRLRDLPDQLRGTPPSSPPTLAERTAMRIGLWLIIWGTRPHDRPTAADRVLGRQRAERVRAGHEASAAMATRLWSNRA